MKLSLSIILPLNWMAVFCVLAAASAAGGYAFETVAGPLFGPDVIVIGQDVWLSLGFAGLFGLTAALFLWCAVTGAVPGEAGPDEYQNVASTAFGVAILAASAMLIFSVLDGREIEVGHLVLVGAIAASYGAVLVERRAEPSKWTIDDETSAAIRRMAQGAAHSSMLPKITGRGPAKLEGNLE